jgi:hypothetical protein
LSERASRVKGEINWEKDKKRVDERNTRNARELIINFGVGR